LADEECDVRVGSAALVQAACGGSPPIKPPIKLIEPGSEGAEGEKRAR